ncbi:hypothetical protein J8M21_20730 [Pseudoalteromonas luteoviolacea]|uniref:hypothetical protein n=1 Tax=Pseudoalteromonas luteoviolacea TaxID=43657 RepID=UPI001B3A4F9E|nr:hypothetical protein [Pseudoalteromonas luteoviolacea]MBQ4879647.1 hypothetical protein [Pseudoalteromonas luteoviolacea]MBQ4909177.1 hypothetical protein [Pseudoalteromonas luteoviolacea]
MILNVMQELLSLVPIIARLQEEADKQEMVDCALHDINNALTETRLYLKIIEHGAKRNLEREEVLVRAWSLAAIPMRHLSKDLSSICDHKAKYWLNPNLWTNSELHDYIVKLDQVADEYRKLLTTQNSRNKLIS